MIRGIERRIIFHDDTDREDFIERLETLCPTTQITCYAWAFMSNHAHFIFPHQDIALVATHEKAPDRLCSWF
ncbi:MAG: hypothetical protein OEV64_07370 [Desulfobulbaceae bacterium]|nr:hypothetical protein [Desulfobulbaceae bacterium]